MASMVSLISSSVCSKMNSLPQGVAGRLLRRWCVEPKHRDVCTSEPFDSVLVTERDISSKQDIKTSATSYTIGTTHDTQTAPPGRRT